MRRFGVDVSSYQGDINWKLASRTIGYVFCKTTEGVSWEDPTFTKARVKALRAAGIPFGPYHFASNSGADGYAEAAHFVSTARRAGWGKRGDLPGVLDIEDGEGGRVGVRFVRRFVRHYRQLTGHRPIIYSGNFWRDALGNPLVLTRCRFWLAAYTSTWHGYTPRAWKKPTFWQYTDSADCPGISGPVDGDRFLKSRRAFRRMRLKKGI